MGEWQETSGSALGSSAGCDAPSDDSAGPTLDDHGNVVLEYGEAAIGTLPASDVRFRSCVDGIEQRWGPLDMEVVLTTRRIVLVATSVPGDARPWSTRGAAPFALRAIEPPHPLRSRAPVRFAGHLQWARVIGVDADRGRVTIATPASSTSRALLTMHVASPFGSRLVAIARAAFVIGRRTLTVDTRRQVHAAIDPR